MRNLPKRLQAMGNPLGGDRRKHKPGPVERGPTEAGMHNLVGFSPV